jgi:hypothetical protein
VLGPGRRVLDRQRRKDLSQKVFGAQPELAECRASAGERVAEPRERHPSAVRVVAMGWAVARRLWPQTRPSSD